MSSRRAIVAVYRPIAKNVGVFVEDGDGNGCCTLTLEEARALHGALSGVLRIASHAQDPVSAVPA